MGAKLFPKTYPLVVCYHGFEDASVEEAHYM